MRTSYKALYLEWFQRAEKDEQSVRVLLRGRGSPDTICFLCQQIVEKYLKGFLVSRGKSFPKIHDLLTLETYVRKITPEIHLFHRDLLSLNAYYINTRYPGDYQEFTLQEARHAYKSAREIQKFIQKMVQWK